MDDDEVEVDVVKRKGAMPILYITGTHGNVRFRDLQPHLTTSDPTISKRLDELEEIGLLVRTFYDEMPPRVEYSLTPAAEDLYEHLPPLFEWAAERAESGHAPGHGDTRHQEQSQACVYCAVANGSENHADETADEEAGTDGDDSPWYRTIDGLITMVGRTHSMGVIEQVGASGPIRYSEIKDRLDITRDAAFSSRLEELHEAGLVERHSYDEVPPRVEYTLTPPGHELAERLRPIREWGRRDG